MSDLVSREPDARYVKKDADIAARTNAVKHGLIFGQSKVHLSAGQRRTVVTARDAVRTHVRRAKSTGRIIARVKRAS